MDPRGTYLVATLMFAPILVGLIFSVISVPVIHAPLESAVFNVGLYLESFA